LNCLCAKHRESYTARGVIFYVVAPEVAKAVLFAKKGNLLFCCLAVNRESKVTNDVNATCFLIVSAVLKSVVAYYVDRIVTELIENSHGGACAHHYQLVLFREFLKHGAVDGVKLGFVLGKSAVEIEGDNFYAAHFYITSSLGDDLVITLYII